MRCATKRVVVVTVLLFLVALDAETQAGELPVAGSPGYDETTGCGLNDGGFFGYAAKDVNDSGTAVGWAGRWVNGAVNGCSAVRWDGSGTAATELYGLGADASDGAMLMSYAINDAGIAIGCAEKRVNGEYECLRAVCWNATGTAATELANLGNGNEAFAINNGGTIVGRAQLDLGTCAVRWASPGSAPTRLDGLGTATNGSMGADAYAINDAGRAVGSASKYVGGVHKGSRAVRWEASGTVATELGDLGTRSDGRADAGAKAVNDAGTAVGWAGKYADGVDKGSRAVRWDALGTAATELGDLGTRSDGWTSAGADAVNNAGTVVGFATKYVAGTIKGIRAVRWNALSTVATELDNLGTDSSGWTYSCAYAVNDAGAVAGFAEKFVDGADVGPHAVMWRHDTSVAIDLNDLSIVPVPAGGTWTLNAATALSADGWVAGEGTFDPDGDGGAAAYVRLWVAQVGLGGAWTNASGGVWGRGPNWSTGTPAMQVGDATFDLAANYTVTLDRDELTKTIAVNAGAVTLDLAGYTLATESGLTIAQGATLQASGTLDSDVVNAGTLAPGASLGTLDVDGDLTTSGTLQFDLAGPTAYDAIRVTGNLSLGGTLEIRLLDGFAPTSGDAFDILDGGALSGQFDELVLPTLPTSLQWDAQQLYASGRLLVGPTAIPGDANHDGRVDTLDARVLAEHWGQTGWPNGDFDRNGTIDAADAAILAANWAPGGENGGGSGAVPEPATAVLLTTSALVLFCRRQRRASSRRDARP